MRRNLQPGDIVLVDGVRIAGTLFGDLALVMRNDDDGLLLAIPEMDELTIGTGRKLLFVGNLAEIISKLGLRSE